MQFTTLEEQAIEQGFKQAADAVLRSTVTRAHGVPGVVVMVANRSVSVEEGASGKRDVSHTAAMVLNTVMAIFNAPEQSLA